MLLPPFHQVIGKFDSFKRMIHSRPERMIILYLVVRYIQCPFFCSDRGCSRGTKPEWSYDPLIVEDPIGWVTLDVICVLHLCPSLATPRAGSFLPAYVLLFLIHPVVHPLPFRRSGSKSKVRGIL